MGILNVTPDSFSDGGSYQTCQTALVQARSMRNAGAAIIDVGGESTRPGAAAVSVDEEIERTIPIISAIATDMPSQMISIDTSKPEVMRAAIAAGAGMVNDIYALRQPGALETVAELGVPVCMMHMQGEPRTMQQSPQYLNVVDDVLSFLRSRVDAALRAGISRENIIVDPGFCFGKTLQHNLRLFHALEQFRALELPLLVGVSRKSMIGTVLEKGVEDRLVGSVALATLACWMGASILRVHDVAETMDALKMCEAVKQS